MRRRDVLAGVLALAASPASARPPIPVHGTPRDLLSPPFVDGDGRDRTLADFEGRVLLVNIWATWCPPCREEMPTLDALQARLGGPNFHVLPLSIDRAGLEPVRRFYRETGIRNLDLYIAEDTRAMLALAVVGLPTTILIDRMGREHGRLAGPAEWNSPEAVAQISALINERKQ
ncbi:MULTISPECIES: TlpA family protein disulfide reductase [Roseivivax]|nr:TlpA disulfide reductase family protein [Roseivivax sediminis]